MFILRIVQQHCFPEGFNKLPVTAYASKLKGCIFIQVSRKEKKGFSMTEVILIMIVEGHTGPKNTTLFFTKTIRWFNFQTLPSKLSSAICKFVKQFFLFRYICCVFLLLIFFACGQSNNHVTSDWQHKFGSIVSEMCFQFYSLTCLKVHNLHRFVLHALYRMY